VSSQTRKNPRQLTSRLPNVLLEVSNRPENVLLVRETLTGVAQAIGLDGTPVNDIRTAVTEAANNVVLHAYAGEEGPLEVEIDVVAGSLEVVVRDRGIGIRQSSPTSDAEPGIGIPVIEALSEHARFDEPLDHGTEVHMTFATAPGLALEPPGEHRLAVPVFEQATTAAISIAPPSLARAVIPRILCVLAARANFSTDRISDSQLLGDALVAHAGGSISGGYLNVAVHVEPHDIELRVGPLIAGRGERLVVDSDVEGLGPVLEKLADAHGVTSFDAHETLTLQLLDRR
jgi:anti-sigma regulatory factor (Ser/Thr protein kinase)